MADAPDAPQERPTLEAIRTWYAERLNVLIPSWKDGKRIYKPAVEQADAEELERLIRLDERAKIAAEHSPPIVPEWGVQGGDPVVLLAMSAYELANFAAVCEFIATEPMLQAFGTGDWLVVYRDTIPQAARKYAASQPPNRTPTEMREDMLRRFPVPSGDTSDDTRRLDWLEAAGFGLCEPSLVDEEEDRNEWRVHCASGGPVAYGFTSRAAIDAAMRHEATS